MRRCIRAGGVLLLAACAGYTPAPIDPQATAASLTARRLDAPEVRSAAERLAGHPIEPWPPASWSLDLLSAAGYALNPEVAVARAEYRTARAALITAGELPNPSLNGSIEHKDEPRPWVSSFGLDLPLELPAKRRARREGAIHASNAAFARVDAAAWSVRSRIRSSLLGVWAAGQRRVLLQRQMEIDADIVELFGRRVQLGETAQLELSRARIAAAQTALLLRDAERSAREARAATAAAVGVPAAALDTAVLDVGGFSSAVPPVGEPMRDAALLSRSDIRAALEEYAIAEAALRMEILRQYPDLHLGPAFGWDQGARTWALAAAAEIPLLNRHRGAIGEAAARRDEASARFVALQAAIIASFERARIEVEAAQRKLADADALAGEERSQVESVRAQFSAGEVDRLALRSTELEEVAAELFRADAASELQQAIGMLEDAIQRPLAGLPAEVKP